MSSIDLPRPHRGEVWRVNFDPTVGSEIRKTRPAVVISSDAMRVLPIRLVAPITSWNATFEGKLWLVKIAPDARNGLSQDSAVDTLQLRGIDVARCVEKIGQVSATKLEEISAAVALVVEF